MAQARSVASAPAAVRVQVIAPAHLGATALAALRARGIDARAADTAVAAEPPSAGTVRAARPANDGRGAALALDFGDDVLAWALDAAPTAALAVELAAVCARAAAAGRPVCLLAPLPRGTGRPAIERAAALAYLRSFGAAVGHDVAAWLESVVLLVRFGRPAGPRAAVIAPPGSWLEAQATALAAEAELGGIRSPLAGPDEPTDVVLYDPAVGAPPPALPALPALAVPVAARGELAGAGDAAGRLFGARAALGAVAILGRAAERIAVGLGPAPRLASDELAIDHERFARQLAKLASDQRRLGDHETKVLLAAYGVPITRQAVATTPSAAVKVARRAGYPVELKPFGHDLPSEPAGCPVERNLTSDAMVRAAFSTVLVAAGRALTDGTGVVIRETPPAGRELAVSFLELPSLGWTVVLDGPGGAPLAAAPAPLRLVDAQALAAHVAASRAGDPDPDRTGLANLLRRASHLAVDLGDRLVRLELPRVVVGGRGARTLVVDALIELT
ncbi:MAG TPA: acetate--CoA ligase family protein [Kofleriaceae bacterium]|nr:acetate--CoA ligase family protein [Kofleriaceae bacterium]